MDGAAVAVAPSGAGLLHSTLVTSVPSGSSDILVQHDGAIATVVFNRPRMRNAITYAMWVELARITEGLVKDESVRAIVYRGAGTVAFASGADISEFEE